MSVTLTVVHIRLTPHSSSEWHPTCEASSGVVATPPTRPSQGVHRPPVVGVASPTHARAQSHPQRHHRPRRSTSSISMLSLEAFLRYQSSRLESEVIVSLPLEQTLRRLYAIRTMLPLREEVTTVTPTLPHTTTVTLLMDQTRRYRCTAPLVIKLENDVSFIRFFTFGKKLTTSFQLGSNIRHLMPRAHSGASGLLTNRFVLQIPAPSATLLHGIRAPGVWQPSQLAMSLGLY